MKSLDYPNRALDREAYENSRNAHRMPYPQFEAYQNLKLKRGERDLADRCVKLHFLQLLHLAIYFFQMSGRIRYSMA